MRFLLPSGAPRIPEGDAGALTRSGSLAICSSHVSRRGPAMSVAIRQIHPVFVGEVSGIDLARPRGPDEVAVIEAGMDRYAVLVYHDQKITDEQQMAFSR